MATVPCITCGTRFVRYECSIYICLVVHTIPSRFFLPDLHKRLDVFDYLPYARFPTHRAPRLRFCLFNGPSEFLLHAIEVISMQFKKMYAIKKSRCIWLSRRMLHWTSKKVKAFIGLIVFLFFVNHFAYLSMGRFDYAYNMKANVVTGIATGVGWIGWYILQRKRKPYAWKILLFQVLVGISLLLELNDFPPMFWVLDAHSLWHLSTVLPTVLLYR